MGCPSSSHTRRRLRRGALLVPLLAAFAAAACGGSTSASPPTAPASAVAVTAKRAAVHREHERAAAATRKVHVRAIAAVHAARARSLAAVHGNHGRAIAPAHASRATVAHVDASSDAVLVAAQSNSAGNATVSAGAPSDAEVRKEIAEAQQAGFALPSGNTASSFAASAAAASISNAQALAVGASIPDAPWNPNQRPIADWIVPVLQWAYQHGWTGFVTSGYRTYLQQAELNAAGDFSAPAGYSNHESTAYPGGAVDVTAPAQLITVLAGYHGPLKLHGGVLGPIDPEHFSATGD